MSTVEMETADLIGVALDWAVLYALNGDGPDWIVEEGVLFIVTTRDVRVGMDGIVEQEFYDPYRPSTRWDHGGPLIDKHRFEFEWVGSDWHGEPLQFFTACGCDMPADATSSGSTHLIAACRAIVRAKLGETVQIPAELANPA
ncbi:phage protein NinX family protein [Pseudomonas pseudonitroreducens]|uniref:phage protein NinX family protein n=1 Tax=Pseudomonas pseudonitroreducens TaxID=2892326 RepID=UPI001F31BACA|nr:phage protein NinX family protein [Pseudomonas pseudonitroreducens]